MLSIILIAAAPAKKRITGEGSPDLIWSAPNSRYPTMKLNSAHTTLTVGDDKPLPGGLAKGDGNYRPIYHAQNAVSHLLKKHLQKKHLQKKQRGNYTIPYFNYLIALN
jgi:hypothetical protein